ncbi:MAG: hypothetical protein ACRBFS_16690 [Aureispira sp.]
MTTNKYENYLKDFFQIMLEKAAVAKVQEQSNSTVEFVYFDLINIAKEQALLFDLDWTAIGLDEFDEWTYLK